MDIQQLRISDGPQTGGAPPKTFYKGGGIALAMTVMAKTR